MANIWDLVVRLTGNGQGLRDDIDEDIVKIEELRDSIQDKDMTVGVDAAQADEALDELKARIAEIDDTVMNITAEDPEANAILDELKLKADELKEIVMSVNIYDEEIAVAELDALSVKAEEFRLALADVPVKLLDSEAQLQLDELKAKLDSIHGKTVVVNVEEEQNGIPASGGAAGGAGSALAGGLMTAAPLAAPVLGDAAGGLGGMLSGMAPGMSGMVGFGAVAVSELKPVFTALTALKQAQLQYNEAVTNSQKLQALKAEQQALAGLDAEQRKALASAQSFGQFWAKYKKQFEPAVLTVFTGALGVLKQLFTDLAPTIKGFASAFVTLQQNAQKALGAPFWKSFFSWMGANAKASTMTFGESLGNLTKGFAALLMGFQPLAKDMEQGWVKMTASFANWATHLSATKGFQQFLTYVAQTGPQVLNLIGQFITLAVNLLEGMAPLGKVMLTIVDTIAKWINGLMGLFPWLKQVAGAAVLFGGVFKLAMLAVSGPWGLLIAAIVTGVMEIIAHWTQIATWVKQHFGVSMPTTLKQWGTVWNQVWDGIKQVTQSVWAYIGPTITNAVKAIAAYWKSIWPELKQVFVGVWDVLKPIIQVVFAYWKGLFNTFFSVIKAIWGPFWSMIGDVLKADWAIIEGVIKIAWNVISGIFKVALDLLTGQWGKAWTDLKTTLSNVWKDIVQMFSSFVRDAEDFGKNLIQGIISGAEAMVQSAISAIGNVVNSIKSAIGLGNSQIAASVSSVSTLNVVHTGSVMVSGLTPRAVQQVNQNLYTTTIRR